MFEFSNYTLPVITPSKDFHYTQSRLRDALIKGGMSEAKQVPMADLAEQIIVQNLRELAVHLKIRLLGLFRGEATNLSEGTGMVVFCVFETGTDLMKFQRAVADRQARRDARS